MTGDTAALCLLALPLCIRVTHREHLDDPNAPRTFIESPWALRFLRRLRIR